MTLEELLSHQNLSVHDLDRTLAWARERALLLTADLESDPDLGLLLHPDPGGLAPEQALETHGRGKAGPEPLAPVAAEPLAPVEAEPRPETGPTPPVVPRVVPPVPPKTSQPAVPTGGAALTGRPPAPPPLPPGASRAVASRKLPGPGAAPPRSTRSEDIEELDAEDVELVDEEDPNRDKTVRRPAPARRAEAAMPEPGPRVASQPGSPRAMAEAKVRSENESQDLEEDIRLDVRGDEELMAEEDLDPNLLGDL